MLPFTKITFKTYPNKWKKQPSHPDTKGTVECETESGEIIVYDYAQWRPREGKSQTMTTWKIKEDRREQEQQEQPPEEHSAPQTAAAPPVAAQPKPVEIKDDAKGW